MKNPDWFLCFVVGGNRSWWDGELCYYQSADKPMGNRDYIDHAIFRVTCSEDVLIDMLKRPAANSDAHKFKRNGYFFFDYEKKLKPGKVAKIRDQKQKVLPAFISINDISDYRKQRTRIDAKKLVD